jgi:hypothetical protein
MQKTASEENLIGGILDTPPQSPVRHSKDPAKLALDTIDPREEHTAEPGTEIATDNEEGAAAGVNEPQSEPHEPVQWGRPHVVQVPVMNVGGMQMSPSGMAMPNGYMGYVYQHHSLAPIQMMGQQMLAGDTEPESDQTETALQASMHDMEIGNGSHLSPTSLSPQLMPTYYAPAAGIPMSPGFPVTTQPMAMPGMVAAMPAMMPNGMPGYYAVPQMLGVHGMVGMEGGPMSPPSHVYYPSPPGMVPMHQQESWGDYNDQEWHEHEQQQPSPRRNAGRRSGGRGPRRNGNYNSSSRSPFLEEFRSSKDAAYELHNIVGHFVEFSMDQHGSRHIQQKLASATESQKQLVYDEVVPEASVLMQDAFGNYVIQKLFEHGSAAQKSLFVDKLKENFVELSLHMYGCRVIQRALETVSPEQQASLIRELDDTKIIKQCVRDQNGNHVIQKCIQTVHNEHIDVIVQSFYGQACQLSTHPYGCRVIQRVLENCDDDLKKPILDEIIASSKLLAEDQYANYVVQHLLAHGTSEQRDAVIQKLPGNVVALSQHKHASNVVEKCLVHGTSAQRKMISKEILGTEFSEAQKQLTKLVQDPFGNYVVQTILEIANVQECEWIVNVVRAQAATLRRLSFGERILSKIASSTRHPSMSQA